MVGSAVFYPRVFSGRLREHARLAFVDLRHFADSDPSLELDRISITTYADDIEHLRKTLDLGDVVLLGHSIHGNIALEYARRYPDPVRGVVVMGSYASFSDERPDAAERLWESEASEERKEIVARRLAALTPAVRATLSPEELWVRENDVAYAPRDWYDLRYDPTSLWEDVVPNIPVADAVFGQFDTYDLDQGPGDVTVPVLIAQGRFDHNAADTLWEEHRHKLPHHTYVLFDESGHFPSVEEPERFDQTLLEWIDTIG